MLQGKSSSNRQITLQGVNLHHQERCLGKVRLPLSRADDFIHEFNQVYAKIGMTLQPDGTAIQKKSQES